MTHVLSHAEVNSEALFVTLSFGVLTLSLSARTEVLLPLEYLDDSLLCVNTLRTGDADLRF